MTDDINEYKCSRCGADAKPAHTCPYNEEIKDDYETLCNCCDDCRRECAYDI